ncbi:MAG: hypothetical protein RL074_120 [Bacteroidota bacterium]
MKKILLFFILVSISSFGQIIHKRKLILLTSPFEMTVVAKDTVEANQYIDLAIAEVKRVENLVSDWKPETQISKMREFNL